MPIFAAIGLGILILILQSLSPAVLSQGEHTVISVLRSVEVIASSSTSTLTAGAHEGAFSSLFDPPALPQAPNIRP